MYGTKKSKLFEVNIYSVYNRLVATVEYVDGRFDVTTHHKTDLATWEQVTEHCEATIRSMERWLADEIAKKLT
jgi:hypothetical protein